MLKESTNLERETITPNNILSKTLSSPRESFNFINQYKYDKHVILLLILSGITKAFDKAIQKDMGDKLPLWGVISFSVIIGILFGWLVNYIYAATISWTGKWFKGNANTQSILRVIAYGSLPSILSLFLLFLQIIIYGNSIFQADGYLFIPGSIDNILYYIFLSVETALVIWSFFLLILGISIAQNFSMLKAFFNLLLPAILMVGCLLIIVLSVNLLIN